jgi:drug/metabolite transporter (DMT)-like permease
MYGLQSVPASRASLIIALCPATTMFGAVLVLGNRLTWIKLMGAALALIGVAIELSGGNPLALLAQGVGRGEVALFGCPHSVGHLYAAQHASPACEERLIVGDSDGLADRRKAHRL